MPLKFFYQGLFSVTPQTRFLNAGSEVYFNASDSVHGTELWKSDGAGVGTVVVKDIIPGPAPSSPGYLTSLNGSVYFTAEDDVHGCQLWKSDGTEAGTVMVKDINPGAGSSLDPTFHDWLVPQFGGANGLLYFVADDGTHGPELWRTDGTEAGTLLMGDIYPGPRPNFPPGAIGIYPRNLTALSGTMYFTANDSIHGEELWESNGTEASTRLVADIYPGNGSSS